MSGDKHSLRNSTSAASIFAALGDPIRLAIVRRLCTSGPLPTVQLMDSAYDVSRQGMTKHLRVLEEVGLVESSRTGRDRHWRLQAGQIATLRKHLDEVSALWDARVERLRSLVEGGDS